MSRSRTPPGQLPVPETGADPAPGRLVDAEHEVPRSVAEALAVQALDGAHRSLPCQPLTPPADGVTPVNPAVGNRRGDEAPLAGDDRVADPERLGAEADEPAPPELATGDVEPEDPDRGQHGGPRECSVHRSLPSGCSARSKSH